MIGFTWKAINAGPKTRILSALSLLKMELCASPLRLGICQKIYTTLFSSEIILHTENASIETIFASKKQRKCIIISNFALFWLKLNKMCKFFNSYEESLHLGVCKLSEYVRNCVVFWKIYTADKNFT